MKIIEVSPPMRGTVRGFRVFIPMPSNFVLTPVAASTLLQACGYTIGYVYDVTDWIAGTVHNVKGYRFYSSRNTDTKQRYRKITKYRELPNSEWNAKALYYYGEEYNA